MQNDEVCKIASKYEAQVVIMHMQKDQTTMQDNPFYEDIMVEIDDFFQRKNPKG